MYIVAGSAMVALGLVGVSLLAWLFRASGTPRWLSSDLAAMLLCIPVTGLMGLGGGYVLIGLSHGIGLVEVTALIGCAAVLWCVRWVIRRHTPTPAALVSTEPPTP
ncbi:MAG TPA: hypothetical protein VE592_01615 [Geminicoccaceae bacterium]|jgi:hypothetical protein|nr:hypothetical protein [Geminicoccaceae bacterium]